MRFTLNQVSDNAVTIMRRLGYVFQYEKSGEQSFIRPLAQAGYPRFHCYVKVDRGRYTFSIHLDQKRETYGQDTRHHGEYENTDALKRELERIESEVGGITLFA